MDTLLALMPQIGWSDDSPSAIGILHLMKGREVAAMRGAPFTFSAACCGVCPGRDVGWTLWLPYGFWTFSPVPRLLWVSMGAEGWHDYLLAGKLDVPNGASCIGDRITLLYLWVPSQNYRNIEWFG